MAQTAYANALAAEGQRSVKGLVYKSDGGGPGYDDFASLEDALFGELNEAVDVAALAAVRAFDELVPDENNIAHMQRALAAFEDVTRTAFTQDTEEIVRRYLDILTDRGARAAGLSTGIRETVARNEVIEGLLDSAKFYTNEHVATNVMPKIFQRIETLEASTELVSNKDFFTQVRGGIRSALDSSDHVVRLTANGAASRAYHWGVVKGGWEAGSRTYVFDAVLDDVTTVVCEDLNGREFNVADAIDVAETRAKAQPEDIRLAAPWFLPEDVANKGTHELVDIGAILPPLHANCRSSIRLQ